MLWGKGKEEKGEKRKICPFSCRLLELLTESELTPSSFNVRSLQMRVSRGYRKLVAHIHGLSWQLLEGAGPQSCDLKLEFTLVPSCYATSMLRELMHC